MRRKGSATPSKTYSAVRWKCSCPTVVMTSVDRTGRPSGSLAARTAARTSGSRGSATRRCSHDHLTVRITRPTTQHAGIRDRRHSRATERYRRPVRYASGQPAVSLGDVRFPPRRRASHSTERRIGRDDAGGAPHSEVPLNVVSATAHDVIRGADLCASRPVRAAQDRPVSADGTQDR